MEDEWSLLFRQKRFRWWVWVIPALLALNLLQGLSGQGVAITVVLISLIAYYELRTRRRSIWESTETLRIQNSDGVFDVPKDWSTLLVRFGGEHGWFGWRAEPRPTLDNAPSLPRLYVKPDPDTKAIRIDAGLGLMTPKVYELGELTDARLGEPPITG